MERFGKWMVLVVALLLAGAQHAAAEIPEYINFSGNVTVSANGDPCPVPLHVSCRVAIRMTEYVWDVYLLEWRETGYTRDFNSNATAVVNPSSGHYGTSIHANYQEIIEIEPDPENPGVIGKWRREYRSNGVTTVLSGQQGWSVVGPELQYGSSNDYSIAWAGTPYYQVLNSAWLPRDAGSATVDLPRCYSPHMFFQTSGPTYNHGTSYLRIEKCEGGAWTTVWELDMAKLPSQPLSGEIDGAPLSNAQLRMTLCDDGAQADGERRPWAILYYK